jgi:radical SAM superfamily enzyme YgiQ (UPF0313 family)
MQKTKVALISLYHYGAFGTRILSDILRRDGHTVHNIFFKRDKTNEMAMPSDKEKHLLGALLKHIGPALIGISTRSTFFPVAKELTAQIKTQSAAPVIWGGAHPTICPEESIEHADIVCVGEGEIALKELACRIAEGKPYDEIFGLWVRTGQGIRKNEAAPLIENLDELPLPDFENCENTYVIEDGILENRDPVFNGALTHYNFMTGRGCPFHCDFCSNSALREVFRGKGRFVRQRGVSHVIAELKTVKDRFKNLSSISTNDEVFGLNERWLEEFCARYKAEIGIPFHCDIHPTCVTDKKIAMLAELGLKTVSMGIQSGSEEIRRAHYGRNTPDAMLLDAGKLFKKYRLFPSYDLIFDNPLETVEDLRKTFDFMSRMPRPFRLNMYSMQHHPRTLLTEKLLSKGFITRDEVDGVTLKGFYQWHVDLLSSKINPEMLFMHRLLVMMGSFVALSRKDPSKVIPLLPLPVIRFIASRKYLRTAPWSTAWAAYLPKLTYVIGLIIQADIRKLFDRIIRPVRNRLLPPCTWNRYYPQK